VEIANRNKTKRDKCEPTGPHSKQRIDQESGG